MIGVLIFSIRRYLLSSSFDSEMSFSLIINPKKLLPPPSLSGFSTKSSGLSIAYYLTEITVGFSKSAKSYMPLNRTFRWFVMFWFSRTY